MLLDKGSIIDDIRWSRGTRSCTVRVSPGTQVFTIADLTARAIIELAHFRPPGNPTDDWCGERATIHTSYNEETCVITVSMTR